jgi:hypothetical protein
MPGSLFHIQDQHTHRRFLCDTGASYSILPHQSSAVARSPPLHGPAGRPIKCWGERELTLTLNNKQYKWIFLLADVSFAIIGIDLLKIVNLWWMPPRASSSTPAPWRSSRRRQGVGDGTQGRPFLCSGNGPSCIQWSPGGFLRRSQPGGRSTAADTRGRASSHHSRAARGGLLSPPGSREP